MRSQSIFSTAFSLVAAIAGVSFLKDTRPPQQPTEAIPTQVMTFEDNSKAEKQIAELKDQVSQVLSLVVAQQEAKSSDTEGLRGSIQAAERGNREITEKLDQVVQGFRGVQSITEEQHKEVKNVVNGLGSRIKKLEGNAENFDTLLERVKALEDEVRVLKTKSVLEKPASNTTPNGSTTAEKVVYPSVQGTTSGGSSGSRVVHSLPSNTVYYPQLASPPVINYQPVQQVEQQWQPAIWSLQPTQQQTCTRKVWDRRSRSWVCVQ